MNQNRMSIIKLKTMIILILVGVFHLSFAQTKQCLSSITSALLEDGPFIHFQKTHERPSSLVQKRFKNIKRSIEEKDLDKLNVPKEIHKYFKSDGSFHYNNSGPVKLSLENGMEKLKTIRLNWNESYNPDSINDKMLDDLVDVMGKVKDLEVLIYTDVKHQKYIMEKLLTFSPEIRNKISLLVNKRIYLNKWAQDGSKPITTSSQMTTYRPSNGLINERHLTRFLENGHVDGVRSKFYFEGGNLVVGKDYIFIGDLDVIKNAKDLKISYEEALNALSIEFGKKVIAIPQIDFHIDLTMAVINDTKTGKDTVLLASPRLAMSLLKKDKVFFDLKNDDLSKLTPGEKDLYHFFQFVKKYPKKIEKLRERMTELEDVKSSLEAQGIKVKEIPDLSLIEDFEYISSPHRIKNPESRSASAFNYSNSIFSTDYALVPETGVRVWDEYFQNIIKGFDREPIGMPVTQVSICQRGGVRCLSETYRNSLATEKRGIFEHRDDSNKSIFDFLFKN